MNDRAQRILCWLGIGHLWGEQPCRPTGFATVGWGLSITRQMFRVRQCVFCGREKMRSGYIIPWDRDDHPEAYGPDGWPLNEDGSRMPART